jgi:hypothetical protein
MCSGGGAPDYSAEMAAQAAAVERSAAADLAFRKEQYADAKPRLEQLYDIAGRVGSEQLEAMTLSNTRADEQNKLWQDIYKPAEIKSAQEAMDAGSESDQQAEAGRAATDARQQQAISTASTNRGLQAMGVNPNSGKFIGAQNANDLQSAANAAGATTNARSAAKSKGIALRAGSVATGRGLQNIAGQTAATASNQGGAATGSANTGAQGGLGYAGMVGQGYSNQTQANSSMFGSYAGLQGQSNAVNAQDSGLGGIFGTIGGAAITSGWRYSDISLKENIKFIGHENGQRIYEFEYKPNLNLPKGKHVGVIAQEVERTHPEAVFVGDNGLLTVDYNKIGVEMRKA